jgi:hypothetical protein
MSKIAYDLDGVFIPDCDQFPNIGGLDDFYALTYYMRPMFKPEGEWSIITARNSKYRFNTMDWVNNHFDNRPSRVWHEIGDMAPGQYKAEVINQNGIEFYIESDPGIVEYLSNNTQAIIIHFDKFCSQNFAF